MSPYREWKSAFAGQPLSVANRIDARDMDILVDGPGPWKAWLEIYGPTETCHIMSHPFIYSRRMCTGNELHELQWKLRTQFQVECGTT